VKPSLRWTAAAALAVWLLVPALGQERSHGLSLHMLPKRVASLAGTQWGFTVDPSSFLTADSHDLTFQSTADLLRFFSEAAR
jgi:hypothetical protein